MPEPIRVEVCGTCYGVGEVRKLRTIVPSLAVLRPPSQRLELRPKQRIESRYICVQCDGLGYTPSLPTNPTPDDYGFRIWLLVQFKKQRTHRIEVSHA